MTSKKVTTKGKGGKAPAHQPDAYRRLAEHISAILNDPATPTEIYNALGGAVCELSNDRRMWDSAPYIELCLRGYFMAEQAAQRKGGAK